MKKGLITFVVIFALILVVCIAASQDLPKSDPVPNYNSAGQNSTRPQGSNYEDILGTPGQTTPQYTTGEITPTPEKPEFAYAGKINVYNKANDQYLRSCAKVGDLSELSANEYYSFTLQVTYNGIGAFNWNSACVSVDGNEPWYWGAGQLASGQTMDMNIASHNMQQLAQGAHTCVWSFDGEKVYTDTFMITKDMNWASVFNLPTQSQIDTYNATNNCRAPYLSAYYQLPAGTKFTEFVVDFKSDNLANGTYCSPGNWKLDCSDLKTRYTQVPDMDLHGYAGFQYSSTGDKVAIMALWDIYCKDAQGQDVLVRAQRVYPKATDYSEDFTGEGEGAHSIVQYPWQANHWYRMHMRCITSDTTGNTVVEQWVCDQETGEYTLLSAYDLGYKNAAFMDYIAVFLENFDPAYGAQVRTMEVCNVMYLDKNTGRWCSAGEIDVFANGNMLDIPHSGSYRFGMEENRLWMITSGLGGKWYDNGIGQKHEHFTIN